MGVFSSLPKVDADLWTGWRGRTAWDVGGNLGQSISRLLETFQYVESFEPATESFAVMALDWVDNPWVRLHRVALSDHDGTLETSVREQSAEAGELVALGMPYEDSSEESLKWGKELGTRPVLCRSVDSLISSNLVVPDFIKVDTNGHEVQVLQGASDVLKFGKTGWLVEFYTESNFESCVKLLQDSGYKIQTVRHPQYEPQSELWRAHGWIRATSLLGSI
jgi:FkbM family methyltransferase